MQMPHMLSAICFLTTLVGSSAFANLYSENAVNVSPQDAFVDISASEYDGAKHQALVAKLQKQERVAAQEKKALELQQRILVAVEQGQQSLEARTKSLEASEDAMDATGLAGHVVVEKGTMKNEGQALGIPVIPNEVIVTHRFQQPSILARMISAVRGDPKTPVTTVKITEQQYWDDQNKRFWDNVRAIVFYMVTTFLVGIVYLQCMDKIVGPKVVDQQVRTDEFQYGAFECGDCNVDWQICLCSWFCGWVRWADTLSHPQVDFLAFWPGLFITALLSATASITFGATMPILILLVVLARQRIRAAYGLPSGTLSVLAWDCCLWSCCPCCAIAQEARQVEYVDSRLEPYYEDKQGEMGNPYATMA